MNFKKLSQVRLFSPSARKRAAIEMSVGTIVTIVLLMTTLILGLVLVRNIFSGSIENINSIDQAVKSEINKLFSEDNNKRIAVYPPTQLITIKKGNQDYQGFAFSIRNIDTIEDAKTFNYEITSDGNIECRVSGTEALNWIKAGESGSIKLGRSSSMESPEFVRFLVPENAPACLIRYVIEVNPGSYARATLDLKVEAA